MIWCESRICVVMYMNILVYFCFVFFKQKTAYEMRISDWSSDVCSSDLSERDRCTFVERGGARPQHRLDAGERNIPAAAGHVDDIAADRARDRQRARQRAVLQAHPMQIGGERAGEGRVISGVRSEEHTSELQSLMRISDAVFCLKKKNKKRKDEKTYDIKKKNSKHSHNKRIHTNTK